MTGAGRKRLRVVVANRPCRHLRIASEVTIWTFVNRDFLLAFTLEPTPSLPSGGQYLFLGPRPEVAGLGMAWGSNSPVSLGKTARREGQQAEACSGQAFTLTTRSMQSRCYNSKRLGIASE
jgi:hypothetical protein